MKKFNKRTACVIALMLAMAVITGVVVMFAVFSIPHPVDLNNLQYGDAVDIGDYRYVYIGCDDVKEFKNGIAKDTCYRLGYRGAILESKRAAVQTLTLYGADDLGINANSFTSTVMGLTLSTIYKKAYESAVESNYFSDGWVAYPIDITKAEYQPILSYVADKPVVSLDWAFYNCANLVIAPTIPETVTTLNCAFENCVALTTAPVIPQAVTSLQSTFANCTALETYSGSAGANGDFSGYVIPDSVIDMSATFYGCASLVTAPVIPNNVTDMSQTFQKCTSLTTAPAIPGSVEDMSGTFSGCAALTEAPDMSGAVSVKYMISTFQDCTQLKTYVGSIDDDGDFSDYIIPAGVTRLDFAFHNCALLTTAPTIPNGVTDMTQTFCRCTSLTAAPVIPDSVTNMYSTFYGCTSLTTAPVIPDGVISLYMTFYGCTSLTEVFAIPSSVTDMTYAFGECSSLTVAPDMRNASSVTNMEGAFSDCTSLIKAPVIPSSVTNLEAAFTGCTSLTEAPDMSNATSVTNMSITFAGCVALTGEIEINANPAECRHCFIETSLPITITGSCSDKTKAKLSESAYSDNVSY